MNPETSLLTNLRDIDTSQPLEIGLAWGVWGLIILALVLGALLLIYAIRVYYKKRQRQQFKNALLRTQSSANMAMAVSLLLKQCCFIHLPKHQVRSLSNRRWVDFLDSKQALSQNLKNCFLYKAYQQGDELAQQDKQDLLSYGLKFINVYI